MAVFKAFCIRGLLSVFLSRAMENLAAEINATWPGSTEVSDHGWWYCYFSNVPWLTEQCLECHNAGKRIVLIGHSFGGTAAIMTTQKLNAAGVKVDLLCPIDPARQYTTVITPNARRVVGFYQKTPGQLGQGVDVEGKGWSDAEWKARTVDYRRDEGHFKIADDPFVHQVILGELRKLEGVAA